MAPSSEEHYLALFDKWIENANDPISKLARERFIEGFNSYGFTLFSKTREELSRDIDEEYADAVVYMFARDLLDKKVTL